MTEGGTVRAVSGSHHSHHSHKRRHSSSRRRHTLHTFLHSIRRWRSLPVADTLLLVILIFLLFLVPLPFGSIGPLSIFTIEMVSLFCIILLFTAKKLLASNSDRTIRKTGLEKLFLMFLFLLLIQVLPLPAGVVAMISPATADLYRSATDGIFAGQSLIFFSLDPYVTISKICEYSAYFMLFFAATNIASNRKSFAILVAALIFSAWFQSFYGLGEAISERGRIFGFQKPHHLNVASGTFISSSHFASYLTMLLLMIVAMAMSSFQSLLKPVPRGVSVTARLLSAAAFRSLLLFGILILVCAAILYSRSRSAIVIALMSVALFLFVYFRSASSIPGKWYWIAATGVVFFVLLLAGMDPIVEKFAKLPTDLESGSGRFNVWKDTISIFLNFPFTGTGAGTFEQVYPMFQNVRHSAYSHAHNDLLQLLSETGALSIVIIGATARIFFIRFFRLLKQPLNQPVLFQLGSGCALIAAVFTALVHFTFQIPAFVVTCSILGGLFFAEIPVLTSSETHKTSQRKNEAT